MNATVFACRLGVSRGWTEFRLSLTNLQDMAFNVFLAVAFVTVLFFQRGRTLEGTSVSLAMATLPGIVGMMIASSGFLGAAGALTVEREDGTLLRMKAIPHGMVGHLVGRIVSLSLGSVVALLIVLVPGLFVVPELAAVGAASWLTLVSVAALGLLATLPWGVVVGSFATSPNSLFGLAMLPVTAVTGISGIFYPIAALPGWIQGVAQVFPVYWLGLGMRSAFLPDSAAAAEISGSWRHAETLAVLGAWAVAGALLAPPVLRRIARQESGADMESRKQQALQRAG
ncbi:MAG TPA: ABC transporter permease [Mycobacteriales bacterium]|jgi:ABC-2 type transport system permease protein